MTPAVQIPCGEGDKDHGESAEDYDTCLDGEDHGGSKNNDGYSGNCMESHLGSLGDEELFDVIKKIACSAVRQLIYTAQNTGAGSSSVPFGSAGIRCETTFNVASDIACSSQDVSYFSDVLDSFDANKRRVIDEYGFGALLLFGRCVIPMPFARWIVDHVEVKSSSIVINNMSILISPQTVFDVIGLPIGGTEISKGSERGKLDFLSAIGANSLPSVKVFGDNLSKSDIPDDEVVRCFLVVALVSFLCPHSSVFPSTEYLLPLVDMKTAKDWDWAKFVHYWLMNQIKRYQHLKDKPSQSSIKLGGCLYVLCVAYLDSLIIGPEVLPFSLPRISVWKLDMIKECALRDRVKGHIYGNLPLLPEESRCYTKRSHVNTQTPTCTIDASSFKKRLLERVGGDLNSETSDGLTTLYMKHVGIMSDVSPHYVQDVIFDVVCYFRDRAECYHRRKTGQHVADVSINDSATLQCCPPPIKIDLSEGGATVGDVCRGLCNDPSGCFQNNFNGHTTLPGDGDANIAMCSQTVLVGSSGDDYTGLDDNATATEIVPSTTYESSQGPRKKRRLCSSASRSSNEAATNFVSRRTRSQQSPLAPVLSVAVDDPEAILRKNRKTCLSSQLTLPQKSTTNETVVASFRCEGFDHQHDKPRVSDVAQGDVHNTCVKVDATVRSRANTSSSAASVLAKMPSASFVHLLGGGSTSSQKSRDNFQSSVNLQITSNVNLFEENAPSFHLLKEFDDCGNFIADPRKRRRVGLSCDGKTIYDDYISEPSDDHQPHVPVQPSPQGAVNTSPSCHASSNASNC